MKTKASKATRTKAPAPGWTEREENQSVQIARLMYDLMQLREENERLRRSYDSLKRLYDSMDELHNSTQKLEKNIDKFVGKLQAQPITGRVAGLVYTITRITPG